MPQVLEGAQVSLLCKYTFRDVGSQHSGLFSELSPNFYLEQYSLGLFCDSKKWKMNNEIGLQHVKFSKIAFKFLIYLLNYFFKIKLQQARLETFFKLYAHVIE